MSRKKPGRRDPVKKNMDIFHKPKTHRNRKKERPEYLDEDLEYLKNRDFKRRKHEYFEDEDEG